MKHPNKLVRDMIGKNNSSTGSQYNFDYSDQKYKPKTAPDEYFEMMNDKPTTKRKGQNMNAIGPYTKTRKGQNMNELRGWN